MITREIHVKSLLRHLRAFPVVAILGPRQIGKTTLARQVARGFSGSVHWLDLEDPAHLSRISEDAHLVIGEFRGLVVIDEVQRRPDLFPLIRVLADRRPRRARFLILGSASPNLLKQSSETLAGRINYYPLPGLSLNELPGNAKDALNQIWLRGGFPQACLARSNVASFEWLNSFVRTFLERDLPQLGVQVPATTMRRFWAMLAHWHGQIWNASDFARSLGTTHATVRRYLDILSDALVVRQLQPWHTNIAKRQVKAPKIYLRDSGLLHAFLSIDGMHALNMHPKSGASWEGLLLEMIIHQLGLADDQAHFWATHGGAEMDLILHRARGRRIGIEIKRTTSPNVTPSMRSALHDLNLSEVVIVHAGQESYRLSKNVRTVAANKLTSELKL